MKKMICMLAALMLASGMAHAGADETLNKTGCMACHAKDKKLVGPSFKDIAAKYKGDKQAPARLAEKVRKGGAGAWGPVPMPPHAPERLNDADLKEVVASILAN